MRYFLGVCLLLIALFGFWNFGVYFLSLFCYLKNENMFGEEL